jgi:hypothetical protein
MEINDQRELMIRIKIREIDKKIARDVSCNMSLAGSNDGPSGATPVASSFLSQQSVSEDPYRKEQTSHVCHPAFQGK